MSVTINEILEENNKLKSLVRQAWNAGYEQGMEDRFHECDSSYINSLFYSENRQLIDKGKNDE